MVAAAAGVTATRPTGTDVPDLRSAWMKGRWLPNQSVPNALRGVELKLARAEHHLDEIAAIVDVVLRGYADAVTPGTRAGGRIPYYLEGAPPIPPELPALFGDALHNMRSALDHLAWQLVLRNGGVPTETTSFPVRLSRRTGGDQLPTISGGVAPVVRVLLDEVQPYTWTDDDPDVDVRIHPLAVLSLLNNIDKHRELLLGVAVVTSGSWSSDIGVSAEFHRHPNRSVADGDLLGALVVDPPDAEIHDFQLDFAVRLVDDGEASVLARFDLVDWALQQAMVAVEHRVLHRFLPLFEATA
jgi:hypothetical protein